MSFDDDIKYILEHDQFLIYHKLSTRAAMQTLLQGVLKRDVSEFMDIMKPIVKQDEARVQQVMQNIERKQQRRAALKATIKPAEEYEKMKVAELKKECERLGLDARPRRRADLIKKINDLR